MPFSRRAISGPIRRRSGISHRLSKSSAITASRLPTTSAFPTRDIGTDPAKIRDFALSRRRTRLSRHRGCRPRVRRGAARRLEADLQRVRSIPRDLHDHGVHRRRDEQKVELVSPHARVLILPQRQTGLVAKQAAQVDILSRGRLRLGVGVGWNHVEYEALNTEWKTRGARQAEQIDDASRGTWRTLTPRTEFHDRRASPTPSQLARAAAAADRRSGSAASDAVVKRAARIGDGYMPIMKPDVAEPKLALLHETMKQHGRDPAKFGLEGWLRFDEPDPQAWAKAAEGWKKLGARIVMLYPMYRWPSSTTRSRPCGASRTSREHISHKAVRPASRGGMGHPYSKPPRGVRTHVQQTVSDGGWPGDGRRIVPDPRRARPSLGKPMLVFVGHEL